MYLTPYERTMTITELYAQAGQVMDWMTRRHVPRWADTAEDCW